VMCKYIEIIVFLLLNNSRCYRAVTEKIVTLKCNYDMRSLGIK